MWCNLYLLLYSNKSGIFPIFFYYINYLNENMDLLIKQLSIYYQFQHRPDLLEEVERLFKEILNSLQTRNCSSLGFSMFIELLPNKTFNGNSNQIKQFIYRLNKTLKYAIT